MQPTRLCKLGHLEQISQNYNHMTFKYLYRMNSTTFLGNLCQCSITRTVKKDNKIKGFLNSLGFFLDTSLRFHPCVKNHRCIQGDSSNPRIEQTQRIKLWMKSNTTQFRGLFFARYFTFNWIKPDETNLKCS